MLSVCWSAFCAGLQRRAWASAMAWIWKGSLSDIWISFLLFLDRMDISENGDCAVVALESEAFAKNFIIVFFPGKLMGVGMRRGRIGRKRFPGCVKQLGWDGMGLHFCHWPSLCSPICTGILHRLPPMCCKQPRGKEKVAEGFQVSWLS